MNTAPTLKRSIRFRDLVLFYIVSGLNIRWTALAASGGPSIVVIWVCALVCFFLPLAASVSELSSRYPEEGGIYLWARAAFGEWSGFIAAWTYWMSNLPFFPGVLYFGAASVLFAFGARAQGLANSPVYFMAFAVGWLGLITLLNIRGVDAGKWLNNVSSLGSLVPLLVLLVLAVFSWMRFGPATHFTVGGLVPHFSMRNALFWSSVFFAFGGVEAGSSMGDEIEDPRRTIPWAILLGGAVMTLGYIGGTGALLVALPGEAVSGPDGFIHGVEVLGMRLGVAWLIAPMACFVALNAVGSAAAYLSSTSRLPFVAGIHNSLPPVFGRIHPRYRTPWVAIGVYGLAGIVVAFIGQAGTSVRGAYEVLASMAIIAYFIPYLFLFAAMIRLQGRPAGPEVRRVPGGRPVAILLGAMGLLSTTLTILLSVIPAADEPNKPLAFVKIVGGAALMVGAGLVVFFTSRGKLRRAG